MGRSYNRELSELLGEFDNLCGVYEIRCGANGKFYVGSTNMTFNKRIAHHISLLRAGKHKNRHLQNCWNKYGEGCFEYNILCICGEEETLEKEQGFLDRFIDDPLNLNINPLASGTPNLSRETIERRAKTLKERYARGEIESTFKRIPTWNKGKTKDVFDYSYLKVPKTITEKLKEAHKNTSIRGRERAPRVKVFTKGGEFLGEWNSAKDLEEWSYSEENNLPTKSRFKNARMGVPLKVLQTVNILRAAKTGTPYKGLLFELVAK